MNLALIGGCGSSGTTLLIHLLSRHPEIVSGPEMKFFNHPEALDLAELAAHQQSLFDRRRLPGGYHVVPTFLRAGEPFGIDRERFATWVENSAGLGDVYEAFARHMCELHGTSIFVEKTPSNVYNFSAISQLFPELPLIHQIRDGRDVVVSLLRRKKSLFHAASLWLYTTLCGLRLRGAPAYLETRYEHLVAEPEKALRNILSHLGLELDPIILSPDAPRTEGAYEEQWHDRKTPRAWGHLPSEGVSASSVGRYRKELSPEQLSSACRVTLTDRTRAELDAPVASFGELLDYLGYSSESLPGSSQSEGERPESARSSRVVEYGWEVGDYLLRAIPELRYKRRLPRRLTMIRAARPAFD